MITRGITKMTSNTLFRILPGGPVSKAQSVMRKNGIGSLRALDSNRRAGLMVAGVMRETC
jgi:hypothetical protein